MKRMVDNKKLKEIESSGGTQWYSHKLKTPGGSSIEFILPFEKTLFEVFTSPIYKYVFGVVLNVNGPSIGNLDVNSTFPILYFESSSTIKCYTAMGNGTIASTNIDITHYSKDIVTKYQVF